MKPLRLFSILLLVFTLAGCAASRPAPPPAPPITEAATPSEEAAPAAAPVEETTPAEEAAPAEPEAIPDDWHLRDATDGPFPGVGVEKAYATVLRDKQPGRAVIVAVIDSGVDIAHEDLSAQIWTNTDEMAGNGIDDDANGYVDDVHGWNFIGGPEGAQVEHDTFELTRMYAELAARFDLVEPEDVPADEQADYELYLELEAAYMAEMASLQSQFNNISAFQNAVAQASTVLEAHLGKENITREDLEDVDVSDENLAQAVGVYGFMYQNGITREDLDAYLESLTSQIEYGYNTEFDPRGLVGDDYSDPNERIYGNNEVDGPDPEHGTHVAGIIAAVRDNNLGAQGIAPVQIMVLRAVPNGDERDKDVANAIRYAADNGAHIINMSFGKSYSPYKPVVDEAVRYAVEKGVLLIHGAGNDGADVDVADNFPTDAYLGGDEATLWLEVGAVGPTGGEGFVAPFSNYGQANVDIFAPGVDIFSTLPGNDYGARDGTSMAAPVVAGVAALVMAYYPGLTAADVREVLLRSATTYAGRSVAKPGTDGMLVDFGTLSTSGAVVNAYEAVRMAETMGAQ